MSALIYAEIPAVAKCYAEGPYRVWLWADHICGVAAYERQDGERWQRLYDLEVPRDVRLNAKRHFGREGGFISERLECVR